MASSKLKGLTKFHWMGIALVVLVIVVIIVVPVVLTQTDKNKDKTTTTTAKLLPRSTDPNLKGYRSFTNNSLLPVDIDSNSIAVGFNNYLLYDMYDNTKLYFGPKGPYKGIRSEINNLFVITPFTQNNETYYYFTARLYNSFARYALRYDGNSVSLDKLVDNTPKPEHLFILDSNVTKDKLDKATIQLKMILPNVMILTLE